MDTNRAGTAFAALGQPVRVNALRLLLRAGQDGLAAGEIAAALDGLPDTMSANLAVLMRAGLIRNRREGRTIRHFADFDGLRGYCPS